MTAVRPTLNPAIDRLGAYAWRLIGIAIAAVGLLWLVGQLWVVFLPLIIATLLARVLTPISGWLRGRGWRPGLATITVLVGFLVAVSGLFTLLGFAVGSQLEEFGTTLSQAVDDVEDWLVEESPLELDRDDIDRLREDAGDAISRWFRSSSDSLVSGAVVALETVVSLLLGLVLTFFVIKDGDRFVRWVRGLLPNSRHELADRLGRRTWRVLGGYLRGAALLGLIEGAIIGVTMALVGAELAVPVAIFVFASAFVPFAGAVVSALLAVLVTLATAGSTGAAIVLVVAIVVQQLDNDLLAPVVYGKELELHPVVILLAIVGGGALFGIAGTVLAVPITAVVANGLSEWRNGPEPLEVPG